MTRAGDLVYCIQQPGDPLQQHAIRGITRPVKGCVYTVASVLPGMNGEDTYILEETPQRGVDIHGDTVLITWQEQCFTPARRPNVAAMLQKVMSTMTNRQLKEYTDDYHEMKAEADRHRKAKY